MVMVAVVKKGTSTVPGLVGRLDMARCFTQFSYGTLWEFLRQVKDVKGERGPRTSLGEGVASYCLVGTPGNLGQVKFLQDAQAWPLPHCRNNAPLTCHQQNTAISAFSPEAMYGDVKHQGDCVCWIGLPGLPLIWTKDDLV